MFNPNFRYTNKIVNDLNLITEARTLILNAALVPKWEVALRREALLKNAHASTAIEGNPLSLEEVTALADGRNIMVRRKDKQEVLNYIEALDKIPDFSDKVSIKVRDLLEIHKIVTNETLDKPEDEGVFRNCQVVVGNQMTGEIVFRPPEKEDVPKQVEEFLEWINSKEAERLNPVIEAGITHYELVRIHPFVDGNGRTARVMATLILYRRGFDAKRFFALDDYYDAQRRNYYEALKKVEQDTLDLTGWLEYFTEGVAISIKAVKDKVIGLSKNIKFLKDKGQIALDAKQTKIVEWAVKNNKIRSSDIQEMFNISRQAAYKIIKKLIQMGVFKKKGSGKATYYVLK